MEIPKGNFSSVAGKVAIYYDRPWGQIQAKKKNWLFFLIILLFFDPLRCTCKMLYLKSECAQTKHKKGF